jgi:hypothetical protein
MTDGIAASIVVVTYNHEKFLAQALDSILRQEVTVPFEIIISEDCSTDRTREIARDYAARYPRRVRLLLSERNLNSNQVCTRALAVARGRYLACVDGDDLWTSPGKLQRQIDFLDAHPDCAACFHDVAVIDETGAVLAPHFVPPGQPQFTGRQDILRIHYVAGGLALFRREALLPLPAWYDEMPIGDWPLLIQATGHGSLGYIDAVLAAYRRHSGGIWSSKGDEYRGRVAIEMLDILARQAEPALAMLARRQRRQTTMHLALALTDEGNQPAVDALLRAGWQRGDVCLSGQDSPAPGGDCQVAVTLHHASAEALRTRWPERIRWRLFGFIEEVRCDATGSVMTLRGWAPWRDDEPVAPLLVISDEPGLEVAAIRLERPDVARDINADWGNGGFWLRVRGQGPLRRPLLLAAKDQQGRHQLLGPQQPLAGRAARNDNGPDQAAGPVEACC